MDQGNLRRLRELKPKDFNGQLGLLLDVAPNLGIRDVPDPYYGGPDAFERMLDLVEPATKALLARVIEAPPVE